MSMQPIAAASSYPPALPVKKPQVRQRTTIDSLPKDLFGQTLYCLEARDLQAMASVSRSMKSKVITEASDSEPLALINFTKRLIEGLNVERFTLERGDLTRVVEDIRREPFASLRFLKEGSILPVRNRLIGIIKRLDDETLANLQKLIPPPKFMGVIFAFARFQLAIETSQSISDGEVRDTCPLLFSGDLRVISTRLLESRSFEEAIHIANIIPDIGLKQSAYLAICKGLTNAGNFDQATDVAELIVSDGSYLTSYNASNGFRDIALALIKGKNFVKASAVIRRIVDSEERGRAFTDLCKALIKTKDFESALLYVVDIPSQWSRDQMIEKIAMALAIDGNVDRAVLVSRSISRSDEYKSIHFYNMCHLLIDLKNFDKATETAMSLLDGQRRKEVLNSIMFAKTQEKIIREESLSFCIVQ